MHANICDDPRIQYQEWIQIYTLPPGDNGNNIHNMHTCVCVRTARWGFGSETRLHEPKRNAGPGPGAYETRGGLDGLHFSVSSRPGGMPARVTLELSNPFEVCVKRGLIRVRG